MAYKLKMELFQGGVLLHKTETEFESASEIEKLFSEILSKRGDERNRKSKLPNNLPQGTL